MLKGYENLLINEGKARSTVDAYLFEIQNIEKIIGKKAEEMLLIDVHNLLTELSHTSPATKKRKLNALRSYMDYLESIGLIEVNVAKKVKTPKLPERKVKYMEMNDADRLMDSITDVLDRAIIGTYLNTGMRLNELVSLNLADLKDGTIRIIGKGDKERLVYLNEYCKSLIDEYLLYRVGTDEALFVLNGKRIKPRTIQNRVSHYTKALGIDGISCHKLRSTFATTMYQNGADLFLLQELMGHADLKTTRMYCGVSNEAARNAVENHPMNRRKTGD